MTFGRSLLIALTLWGLAMILPDLVRVAQPLATIGLFADGDGLITDVTDPFPDDTASPAWRAGIRIRPARPSSHALQARCAGKMQ
jgi:hypothetical protein